MAMVAYQQPVAQTIWPIFQISRLILQNRLDICIFTYCPAVSRAFVYFSYTSSIVEI